MTTKQLIACIAAIVITVAIYGAYQYPALVQTQNSGSPAGTSFNSAKLSAQQVTLGTTTVFSQYNGDASDRIIRAAELTLRGAISTTTTFAITCSTSTSASAIIPANSNPILALTLSGANANQFGTTTAGGMFLATSSPGVTGTSTVAVGTTQNLVNPFARNWGAGTYLDCLLVTGDGFNSFNAGTNGVIAFPYLAQ